MASRPAPKLVVHPGMLDERAFDLKPGTNTVGRTRDNDVCILDDSLSRAHARIEVRDDAVVLTDLGSKNGTTLDGVRVDTCTLGDTHAIVFGYVPCKYVAAPAVPAQITAPTTYGPTPKPAMTRSVSADVTHADIGALINAARAGAASAVRAGTVADRDRDRLRILLKVSQLLASPASLDALLSSVLDLVFDILDIDRAAVLMVNSSTGELEPRVARSRKGDATFSRSIVRYVVEHSVAALFSDARSDQRLAHAGSVYLQSIRTSMCAPLKPRDEVLGVLYVDNLSSPDRFDAEDLEFLTAFANQAAIAIDNANLHEKLAREAITRNSLLRFFPPATVPALLDGGGVALAPVEREATVLFADISEYTSMSSRMRPTEIIEMLNAYFPKMAEIVFRYGGTLEKYIGDALMAVWGVPLAFEDDAVRAVHAAIEMQRAVVRLNEGWNGAREIGIHIGVNTGMVAAGNIGSKEYIQYATIGDATNVASRICGVGKRGEIVVDEGTASRAQAAGVEFAALGPVQLRGKAEAVNLYRVV